MSLSKVYKHQDNFQLEQIFLYPDAGFSATAQMGDSSAQEMPSSASRIELLTEDAPPVADNQMFNKEQVYNLGKQAGLEQAEQEIGQTISALGIALEEIGKLREATLKKSINDMLLLVMVISKQVIEREIEINPDVIISTISRALHAAVKSDEFHLIINPLDLELVDEKKPFFIASISGLQNITIETSEKISRGGCLLESVFGEVDASIEGQLEQIREQLTTKIKEDDAKSG